MENWQLMKWKKSVLVKKTNPTNLTADTFGKHCALHTVVSWCRDRGKEYTKGGVETTAVATSQLGPFSGIHSWIRQPRNHRKKHVIFFTLRHFSVSGATHTFNPTLKESMSPFPPTIENKEIKSQHWKWRSTCFLCFLSSASFLSSTHFNILHEVGSLESENRAFKAKFTFFKRKIFKPPTRLYSSHCFSIILVYHNSKTSLFFLTMGIITHLNIRISFMQFHRKPKSWRTHSKQSKKNKPFLMSVLLERD